MSVNTPDTAVQVASRIAVDIQREAPDSNPFLNVNWIKSLGTGIANRQFAFYLDLERTEKRLFPDTATGDAATRWGGIYVGPANVATGSSGNAVATGSIGGVVPLGQEFTSNGITFASTSEETITANTVNIASIERSGTTATAITSIAHGLSSFVLVTITGSNQTDYNIVESEIMVTGLYSFTFEVSASATTPGTGSPIANFNSASVPVTSDTYGDDTNLDADTPLALGESITGVDSTLYVDFGAVAGGTDDESSEDYKDRYLDKIRNPVAHFNKSDIESTAKKITGVTRVFVNPSGSDIGTLDVTGITRNGSVATVTTSTAHGFSSGQATSISGATESDYNVSNQRIIVLSDTSFAYFVDGTPSSPATGAAITCTNIVPLGQVITYFMRDNDDDAIPTASEVEVVKDAIDEIVPATTWVDDNIVLAPTGVSSDFDFISIYPDSSTMRSSIAASLAQFFSEDVEPNVDVSEDAYRAAIQNTVDLSTSEKLVSFELSTSGDIATSFGEIAILGAVTHS